MCKCFKVSRNAYYHWKKRQGVPVEPARKDVLKDKIREIWEDSRQIYGSHKIQAMLHRESILISRSYVFRLMKQMGIKSAVRKRYVTTTVSDHEHPVAQNLLSREFQVSLLGKVWVSDITYIRLGEDWLYLTVIIDLADRKVVGWSLSGDMTTENTIMQAWKNARRVRDIMPGFLFHSDRGVQYSAEKTRGIFLGNTKA